MQQINIPIGKLSVNDGQIKNVPSNPRFVKTERYEKLKQSIKDDPEMLELREILVYPVDDKYVVIGGNMRLRAMTDLGYKECPCKVIPEGTSAKKLRAYVIKDNLPFGENDMDLLANEWDMSELESWGMEKWLESVEDIEKNSKKQAKEMILEDGIKVKVFLLHPEDWINQKNQIVNFLQDSSIRFEIVE